MKKKLAILLAAAMLLTMAACGAAAGSASKTGPSAGAMAAEDTGNFAYDRMESNAMANSEDVADYDDGTYDGEITAESGAAAGENTYQRADVKLIRRASLSVETQDLDKTTAALEALVDSMGGYIEESNVYQGSYGSTYRNASYTIRVPSGKYQDFLNQISDESLCHLVRKDESTEDVGQAYFDTETRLSTLRTKLERLQALLKKADKMEDIITIENAISDTEYQIDKYASTLNRYDSLIGYATFYVSVDQVNVLTDNDTNGFGERLVHAFSSGVSTFAYGAQEFILWLAEHILNMIVLILVVLLIVKLIRRILRRRKEKRAIAPAASESEKEEQDH